MILIQIFLLVIAVIALVMIIGERKSYAGKAYKKIGLIILALAMIIAVLFPSITNVIAHAVGVGRGTDLLLYMTVAGFILYAINNYLQLQDQRDTTYRLARYIALMEAKEKYPNRKK
jgi:hypothetical protein